MNEDLLLQLCSVFLLGISAQWIAWWFRLPSILFLLTFGFLAGPYYGFIQPDEMLDELLFPVVSLSVALILFEGSLSLRMAELRQIGRVLIQLLTVGVVVTWVLCACAAHWILDLGWQTSILLGALLVVTGPTVVGPLLRQVRPIGSVGAIARWEGIVIDPVGAVLALLVFEVFLSIRSLPFQEAIIHAGWGLLQILLIAFSLGFLTTAILVGLIRKHWIPEYLQNPVTLMLVVGSFMASNILHEEAGLATVTLMGIFLANQKYVSVRHILEFKENLSVLLISTLFILLSARLELADFKSLGWKGPVFVAIVILLIRPVAVVFSTIGSSLTKADKIFLAWMAPRGIVAAAVASIFALQAEIRGVAELGEGLVPATFLVITGTVLVYGLTSYPLALKLKLSLPDPQGIVFAGSHRLARAIAAEVQRHHFPVLLIDSNRRNIQTARMEGLPTYHGDLLAEDLLDRLNLGGIGRFLSMTPNEEANSLAALHFSELFGRTEVYQLPPEPREHEHREATSTHLRGQYLFHDEANYRVLQSRITQGFVVKTTELTPEFKYESFQEYYNNEALVLFLVDGAKIHVCTIDETFAPKAGQKLIAIVPPSEAVSGGSSIIKRREKKAQKKAGKKEVQE